MKYVKYTTEIVELLNVEIKDIEEIKVILSYLQDRSLFCSVYLSGKPEYHKCKILSLDNDRFKFIAFISNSSFSSSAKIEDILQLKVDTLSDRNILLNPELGRGDLLGRM